MFSVWASLKFNYFVMMVKITFQIQKVAQLASASFTTMFSAHLRKIFFLHLHGMYNYHVKWDTEVCFSKSENREQTNMLSFN